MRWAGDVAGMMDRRGAYRILVGETGGKKNRLEDPGADGTMGIKWILRKWDGEEWTGLM